MRGDVTELVLFVNEVGFGLTICSFFFFFPFFGGLFCFVVVVVCFVWVFLFLCLFFLSFFHDERHTRGSIPACAVGIFPDRGEVCQ